MTERLSGAEGISDYKRAVDAALQEACGVTYTALVDETAPSMDRDGQMLRGAAARSIPAAQFAQVFQRAYGLMGVAKGTDAAQAFNLYRAALVSFGNDARGWKLGSDGRAYLAVDGGRALRLDIATRDGKWGFAVSESGPGVTLAVDPNDPLRRVAAPAAAFAKLSARLDIGDAVADAMRLRSQRRATPDNDAAPAEPEVATPGLR